MWVFGCVCGYSDGFLYLFIVSISFCVGVLLL